MFAFENHWGFCLVGYCQSEQHISNVYCNDFHQLVSSLQEENHLEEIKFLILFHPSFRSNHQQGTWVWMLLMYACHLRLALMMIEKY
jgi:hypothetical protein